MVSSDKASNETHTTRDSAAADSTQKLGTPRWSPLIMIKSPPLQNPSPAVAAAEPVIGVTAAPISAFRRFMSAVVVPPPAVVPPPPKMVPPRVIRTAEATVTDPYDEAEAMVIQAMKQLVATNSRLLQMAAHGPDRRTKIARIRKGPECATSEEVARIRNGPRSPG